MSDLLYVSSSRSSHAVTRLCSAAVTTASHADAWHGKRRLNKRHVLHRPCSNRWLETDQCCVILLGTYSTLSKFLQTPTSAYIFRATPHCCSKTMENRNGTQHTVKNRHRFKRPQPLLPSPTPQKKADRFNHVTSRALPTFAGPAESSHFAHIPFDESPKPIPLNDKTKPARSPFSPRHKPITMVSLAPFVLKRPWLTKMLTPAANWYANAAGYRQLGLRYETATNLL